MFIDNEVLAQNRNTVAGGSGITANADNLALGPLTADWSQTRAFDLALANAASVPFAAVDVRSFESTQTRGIHVIGDSSKTTLPKAGHVGNQGAKICADAIVKAFNFQPPDPSPTANSACFSPVSSTLASWLTAVYQYDAGTGSMVIRDQVSGSTSATEARAPTTGNFGKMGTWFKTLMGDTFA